MFTSPLIIDEISRGVSIQNEIDAYADTSRVINETFQLFSQSELNDDDSQTTTKKNPTFHRIQTAPKENLPTKFATTTEFAEIEDEMFGEW